MLPRSKLCLKCGNVRDTKMFSKNKSKKDGLQSNCKICCRKTQGNHYIANKSYYKLKSKELKDRNKKYILILKQKGCCSICGDKRWYVLDYHHLEPKLKTHTITKMVLEGYSIDRINKEVKKCVLLCSNCHRELHYTERSELEKWLSR